MDKVNKTVVETINVNVMKKMLKKNGIKMSDPLTKLFPGAPVMGEVTVQKPVLEIYSDIAKMTIGKYIQILEYPDFLMEVKLMIGDVKCIGKSQRKNGGDCTSELQYEYAE
jgi:hypothetical protein